MSAIVKHGFTPEQVTLIKNHLMSYGTKGTPPTDSELSLYGMVCSRLKLDPFAKHIYAIQRKGKWSFEPSIDGLRAIAERTGLYAGSDEPLYDEGLTAYEFLAANRKIPRVCKITVWKIVQGIRCPFTGTATYDEYCQKYDGKATGKWQESPLNMMSIAAERQALRKGFPQCNSAQDEVNNVVEAIEVEAADPDQWRINGYNWGIEQGVSQDTAREISNVAKDAKDLHQRMLSAIPTAKIEA
ncbi:recombinase RecT [Synechocystis sp. FACHB-383]|uniref:RecT family recombinase n=1 Tax=Synechocystis sp. FACHB-383 TaxID=2692864 RepID=UPI0016891E23|nr:RecT family recombinase [Synechocystis sp. FACHB-383]MBD2653132.1 recombinase RecT [Synechocystis sp. FACHB-383]